MRLFYDFKSVSVVNESIIREYKNKIPQELVDIWEHYGYGSFLDGYLKVINPDEYHDLLKESYFRGGVSIPIFATGLADIITWEENKYLRIVKYRRGNFHGISAGFEFFLTDLLDNEFCNRHLDWQQYKNAVEIQGILDYDECFGYVPLLGLGGLEKVENLNKFKIREHIMLVNELVGPIQ